MIEPHRNRYTSCGDIAFAWPWWDQEKQDRRSTLRRSISYRGKKRGSPSCEPLQDIRQRGVVVQGLPFRPQLTLVRPLDKEHNDSDQISPTEVAWDRLQTPGSLSFYTASTAARGKRHPWSRNELLQSCSACKMRTDIRGASPSA